MFQNTVTELFSDEYITYRFVTYIMSNKYLMSNKNGLVINSLYAR